MEGITPRSGPARSLFSHTPTLLFHNLPRFLWTFFRFFAVLSHPFPACSPGIPIHPLSPPLFSSLVSRVLCVSGWIVY